MEKDERLLPLPTAKEVQLSTHEYPAAYSPIYEEEGFNEQRSLREYFNVIYKRLPLILALAIVITSVVAFYMYRQPSMYEAQTTMIIEPPKQKVTAKDSININFGGDANYINTQLKLLQSNDLMRDVVVRLGLHRDPNLFANQSKSLMTTLRSLFSSDKSKAEKESSLPVLTENSDSSATPGKVVLTPEESERANTYAGMFLSGLRVEPVERTNLVNVSVQSTNPELAAKVADMTAKMFIENDVERETSGAKQTYEELSKSIDDLKKTIAGQEMDYIKNMQDSNIPLQNGKGNDFNAERLQTISTNLLAAEDDRRKIQAKYEAAVKASDGKGGILSADPDNKAILAAREMNLKRQADLEKRIETLDEKIKTAQEKRQTLLVNYTEEYKDVKIVTAQISELEEQKVNLQKEVSQKIESEGTKLIKNAENEVVTGLRAQFEAAQRREKQLQDDYQREASSANLSGVAETRLTTLKREIETNRGLLDTYTQRQKEQELAISSGRPDNLKISTSAVKPTDPIGPQRNRNIIVAFLVSLAAGIGLAFLLDYLDDSIRTSDDVGRHLGLPTLALIPHQVNNEKKKLLPAKNGNAPAPSTALIALEDTRSAMAEAYRHLRTSLLFSSAGKPPQTILVTSSQPSEGKTTTAINTAITLAQSGAEVVIIDCDLRRPRLHNHFDLDNTAGLTNYLSGEKNTDLLMKSCPGLPKMKIITSGPIPPNPAELLSSQEMKNLLQFLKGNFKHVIIDSPPAISFTDAAILSTLVDGVVLVAMAGKSSIHLMRRFKQRLANIGARIYGVVLNGIKSDSVEYGYYGYGYTYNYYNSPEDDSTPRMEEIETVSSIHTTKG
ncbi:MAG TPA: polysaccharide biosynthesis tyrosine autokinase [Pyrinomonadaceae bacterium]|nr:polysaccharide biosynthesis tyrosine autokinase [Pyrinomonadaceae bacterium]